MTLAESRPIRFAISVVALLVLVGAAPAAEVPESAYSIAVQTSVELLDDDNLVFLFPHHGAGFETRLQMSALDTSVRAGGANARFGRHAGLLLASSHTLSYDALTSTLAQVAFATGGESWRAGLALRGSRYRDAYDNRDELGETVARVEYRDVEIDYSEAALSLGWRGERAFVDIVAEAILEDTKVSSFASSSSDTSGSDLVTDAEIRWRGALRVAVPVGGRTEVRGWGSFRNLSTTWDVVHLVDSVVDTSRTDLYGHVWGVALAVVHTPADGSLTRVFAGYENSRPPEAPSRYFYGDARRSERDKSDRVRAGFSLERPVWWELRFLTGFQGSFRFLESVEIARDPDGDSQTVTRTREYLEQSFSWGVRREIGAFDLTGAMRTDLALLDRFVSLDARVRFR